MLLIGSGGICESQRQGRDRRAIGGDDATACCCRGLRVSAGDGGLLKRVCVLHSAHAKLRTISENCRRREDFANRRGRRIIARGQAAQYESELTTSPPFRLPRAQ